MKYEEGLDFEVARILDSEAFSRAPSQSKILSFLDKHSRNNTGSCTQYDIAVEALGKSESFDESLDSSVRVQIGRLRKSLTDYYRANLPGNELCVYIRPGEYRLRLGSIHTAYPDIEESARMYSAESDVDEGNDEPPFTSSSEQDIAPAKIDQTQDQGRRRQYAILVALAGLIAVVLIPLSLSDNISGIVSPARLASPSVSLDLKISGDQDFREGLSNIQDVIEADADSLLQKSLVSRKPIANDASDTDYSISINLTPGPESSIQTFVSLRSSEGELIAEKSSVSLTMESARNGVSDAVTSLISPAGALTKDLSSRIRGNPANGFECFIAVESYRANTNPEYSSVLEYCLGEFEDSDYYPYFAARDIFGSIQKKIAAGEAIDRESAEWREMSVLLDTYPDNAYANTVAAKLLVGHGDCEQARDFAAQGFSRGRTYPALELAIITDAYGCSSTAQYRPFWSERIARVAGANPDPHALLESYILIGAIASGQAQILDTQRPQSFIDSDRTPLESFNQALRRHFTGNLSTADRELIQRKLPTLVWNSETRERILNQIMN